MWSGVSGTCRPCGLADVLALDRGEFFLNSSKCGSGQYAYSRPCGPHACFVPHDDLIAASDDIRSELVDASLERALVCVSPASEGLLISDAVAVLHIRFDRRPSIAPP